MLRLDLKSVLKIETIVLQNLNFEKANIINEFKGEGENQFMLKLLSVKMLKIEFQEQKVAKLNKALTEMERLCDLARGSKKRKAVRRALDFDELKGKIPKFNESSAVEKFMSKRESDVGSSWWGNSSGGVISSSSLRDMLTYLKSQTEKTLIVGTRTELEEVTELLKNPKFDSLSWLDHTQRADWRESKKFAMDKVSCIRNLSTFLKFKFFSMKFY
jgi:hypothetical protein